MKEFPLYDKKLFEDWLDRFNQDDVVGPDSDDEVLVEGKDYVKYFRFVQKISNFHLKKKKEAESEEDSRQVMVWQYRKLLFLLKECPFIDNFSINCHISYDMPHQDFLELENVALDEFEDFMDEALKTYSKYYYFRYDIGMDLSDTNHKAFNDWLHGFWKNICKKCSNFCYDKWFGACNVNDIKTYREVDRIAGKMFDASLSHFFRADEVRQMYLELFALDGNVMSDEERSRYNRYENGKIHILCYLDWIDKHPETFSEFEVKWHGKYNKSENNHMSIYNYVYLIPKKAGLTTDDAGRFLQSKLMSAFNRDDFREMNATEVLEGHKVPEGVIYTIVPDDMKKGKSTQDTFERKAPEPFKVEIKGVLLNSNLYKLFCNPAFNDPIVDIEEFERIGKNTESHRKGL